MKTTMISRMAAMLMVCGVAAAFSLTGPVLGQEPDAPKSKEKPKKGAGDDAASVNPDDPSAVKVYLIDVKGDFGKDFSPNLMKELLADAKKVQPDMIIFRVDAAFLNRKGNGAGNLFDPNDTSAVLQGLFAAEGIGQQMVDDIDNDPEWKVKPRRIAWVKKAVGPAAVLPFFCKEIYFASDAMEGGIGYMDLMFGNLQSNRVREKMRGLWQGHIESLAIKGGHDFRIVRAMLRVDYELSYTLVGGKPVFYENRTDGEVLLTDDGVDDRADSPEDFISMKGNDVLNLRADVARTIGWSNGTVDSLSDLMFETGHSRAYKVISEPARKISAEFGAKVHRSAEQYGKLDREVKEGWERRGEGDTTDDRNRNRGKLKRDLEEMNGLLKKYPEIAHRHGAPEELQSENNQRIAVLEQEIRLDKNAPKRPGGGGGIR
jgi:hypothetical protein